MSEKLTIYDDARFYDVVHGAFATPGELAFYKDKIKRFGEPVLELACGSGVNLIPLAESNFEIIGIDISDEMMMRAQEKAIERNVSIDVRRGDMREFNLDKRFNLILVLGNSLQHLLTREDVEKCFAAVRKHLFPNGRFIIEVFNPFLKILSRSPDENVLESEHETSEGKFNLTGKVDYDSATQINHIEWIYRNISNGEKNHFYFTMRQFFPQELDALLFYNGFQVEEKFGDRDGSPFTKDSPRQIVVAKMNS